MLYCYEHRVASEVSCWTCVWCLNHWTPTRSMILIYTFRSLPTKVFFWFHCILQPNRPTGHCQRFWTGGPLLWVTLCLKIRAFATWKMVDMEREIFQDSNFQDGAESSRNRWVGTQHERTYDGHRIYDEMWCRHHWPQKIWLPPRGPNFGPKFSAWDQNLPLFCFVTSSGLSRLGHEAQGAFGVKWSSQDFFGRMTWPYPWRIHGAAIYIYCMVTFTINIPSMLAYIYYIYTIHGSYGILDPSMTVLTVLTVLIGVLCRLTCYEMLLSSQHHWAHWMRKFSYIHSPTYCLDGFAYVCVCAIHISYMYIYNYIYIIYHISN